MSPDLAFVFKEINFLILVLVLFFLLHKPVREFFANRSLSIRTAVEEAKSAHTKAVTEHEAIQQRLGRIEKETAALMQSFREEADLERKKILEQAQTFATRIRDDAQRIADSELKKAKEQLKETTITLARELAEKGIQRELSPMDEEQLHQNYIRRLRSIH